MVEPIEPYLTKKTLALKWQVTRRSINRWMAEGKLPYIKIGGLVRFRGSDVEEFEKKRGKSK